jgi:hypothetical protein
MRRWSSEGSVEKVSEDMEEEMRSVASRDSSLASVVPERVAYRLSAYPLRFFAFFLKNTRGYPCFKNTDHVTRYIFVMALQGTLSAPFRVFSPLTVLLTLLSHPCPCLHVSRILVKEYKNGHGRTPGCQSFFGIIQRHAI